MKLKLKAFLNFDVMVLPILVKVVFVLGVAGILMFGLWLPFSFASTTVVDLSRFGAPMARTFDFARFLVGGFLSIFLTAIGLVWWRITCELAIILFKIHEDLILLRSPRESKSE